MKMEGMELTNEQSKNWKLKRLSTFIVFWLVYLFHGMSASLFRTTGFIYVEVRFKTQSPYLIYSLIAGMRYLPVFMFIFVVSNLHDKYRKTRLMLIIINFLTIAGGILYIVDLSYYFPMIGSFLLGFPYLAQTIAVSEITRSHTPREVTYKVPVLQFGFFLGALPAAVVPWAMKYKFNVGPFLIDDSNILGLLMIIGFSSIQLLTVNFVHDLSREFDLKESLLLKEQQNNEEYFKESAQLKPDRDKSKTKKNVLLQIYGEKSDEKNIINNLKRLFSNRDITLMYFLVGLFYYCWAFGFTFIPPVFLGELQYDVQILNGLFLAFSLLMLILLPFLLVFKIGSKTAYYFGFFSFFLLIIVGACFQLLDSKQDRWYNITLLSVVMALFSLIICGEDIFLTCTIAKLVKPDIQTFADGIRLIFYMIGCVLATGSVVFAQKHRNILFMGLLIVFLFSLSLLFMRRKTLMNPHAVV